MQEILQHVAYAVMVLDISVSPPRIVGVGIYSEPEPTMKSTLIPVVVTEVRSFEGYGDARQRLMQRLEQPMYGWVKSLMSPR